VQLYIYKYGVKGESKGQGKIGRRKDDSRRGEDKRVGRDSNRRERQWKIE